ncbi:hypothetical protein M378DRAFT_161800 [Amanita muscaria Koide BX008]|uniref:DRBM domain-containing protein n=1 Tax=Amanita muscaria (strain Koide BX008) TaxID=946122 RepID=A0A0C2XAE4_AMAMK|nr:hypothetical protein M378DRAFT_161800 [Amanita muscaria Koide BX008]
MEGRKNCQRLHNYVGTRRLGKITYEDKDQLLIPGNRHIWTSTVQVNGTTYGNGQGETKLDARDRAAGNALPVLQAQFGP